MAVAGPARSWCLCWVGSGGGGTVELTARQKKILENQGSGVRLRSRQLGKSTIVSMLGEAEMGEENKFGLIPENWRECVRHKNLFIHLSSDKDATHQPGNPMLLSMMTEAAMAKEQEDGLMEPIEWLPGTCLICGCSAAEHSNFKCPKLTREQNMAHAKAPQTGRDVGGLGPIVGMKTPNEIPVTEEMIAAGADVDLDGSLATTSYELVPLIYRAMRKLEPMRVTPGLFCDNTVTRLHADNVTLRALAQKTADQECVYLREIAELKRKLAFPDQAGDHPYNGPVKDGASIPDETHERFYKSVGDVIAGRVMPVARKQMEDALANAPKEKPTFDPRAVQESDRRKMGLA
jgi:hypothetical protein